MKMYIILAIFSFIIYLCLEKSFHFTFIYFFFHLTERELSVNFQFLFSYFIPLNNNNTYFKAYKFRIFIIFDFALTTVGLFIICKKLRASIKTIQFKQKLLACIYTKWSKTRGIQKPNTFLLISPGLNITLCLETLGKYLSNSMALSTPLNEDILMIESKKFLKELFKALSKVT